MRWDGRVRIWITIKLNVIPPDRPGFLGADSSHQAERDVSVHQRYPNHQQREDSTEPAHGIRALADEAHPV